MKILYFLEEKIHIDMALKDQQNYLHDDFSFVSLDPTSTHFLKMRNTPYRIPESYFSEGEINSIKDESDRYVNRKIDEIDNYLVSTFPQLNKVKPARYNYYNFYCLLNLIPVKVAIIDKIIKEEKPEEIVYFDSGIKNEAGDLFSKESTWGLAIATVVKTLNLKKRKIVSPAEFGVEFQDSQFLKRFYKIKRRLFGDYSKKIKRKMLKFKQCFLAKKNYPQNLLFLSRAYDLEFLINEPDGLMNYPVGLYLWDLDRKMFNRIDNLRQGKDIYALGLENMFNNFSKDTQRIWEYLKANDDFREMLTFNGYNYFSAIQYKLERIFGNNLAEILFVDYALPHIIEKFNIRLIISNENIFTLRQAVFYHRSRNIPMVNFYQGLYLNQRAEFFNYCGWQSSEINFTFGEGVSYLARQHNPGAAYIPLGSIGIDNIPVSKERKRKKRILYLFTNYSGNNFALWSGTYYPENFHYYYQDRIINKLREYSQYKIVLKLHPSLYYKNPPMIELFKTNSKGQIRIIKDACGARELFTCSDLVIIDTAWSATTLLQSIKAEKPVLLFNALGNSVDGKIKELMKKRVEYSEDIDEFIDILDRYLKDAGLWTVPRNDEYLRKYGTHLNDGKSCKRSAEAIMALVNKPKGYS